MSSEVTSGNLLVPSVGFNAKYTLDINNAKSLKDILCNSTFLNNLAQLFVDYSDYVNSLKWYPFRRENFVTINPSTTRIKFGNVVLDEWNIRGGGIVDIKKSVLIGSVRVDRRYNNFLDYEPYTKIELYVPYFSFLSLPANEVIGKIVYIYLSVDFDTGIGTIYIQVDGRVIMTSSTKLGIDIPIGSTNLNQIMKDNIANITKIAGGVVTMIAGEGLAKLGGLAVAGQGALNMATHNTLHYQRGSLSGGNDMLGSPTSIFAIVTRPNAVAITENYNHIKGKPLGESRTLATLSGFTIVEDIHLEDFDEATSEEVNEIQMQLKTGVYL